MKFSELDELFRQEIADEAGAASNDSRVTPKQSLAYANEAEAEACRRARLLVDSSTAAICQIALEVGKSVYPYDPRIILIRRAKLTSATRPLGKVLFADLDEQQPGWEDRTGKVEGIVTGMDTGAIRLYRIPTAIDTLNLTAVRLPLKAMAGGGDSPEINPRFHRSLVYWMKHKAYNNQNSELFDKNRADVHLTLFEQEFGPKSSAISEVFDEMNYFYGENGSY
jgi:hypothetical protein